MTLYVDTRYRGNHGIARYAAEVLSRLQLEVEALPVSRNPTSPSAFLERGWRVPRRQDVVYSPGFGTGVSKATQLLTVHDLIHLGGAGPRAAAQKAYYELAVKPAIRRAGRVITVSETSARLLREWLRDDNVEVRNAGNGCSEVFTPSGPTIERAKPYVLYVGNSRPHKNPRVVVETMRHLPDFQQVIVSRDGADFMEIARDLGVHRQISIVTDLNDEELAAYYRGAAALLFPSVLEGFGLPAAEALACGTGVVYFRGCESVREIVGSESTAVVDPTDSRAFASAISRLADGSHVPDERKASWSWDDVALRVREVLMNA